MDKWRGWSNTIPIFWKTIISLFNLVFSHSRYSPYIQNDAFAPAWQIRWSQFTLKKQVALLMGKKQKYCQIVNSLQFFCPLEWKLLSLSALKNEMHYERWKKMKQPWNNLMAKSKTLKLIELYSLQLQQEVLVLAFVMQSRMYITLRFLEY